MDASKTPQASRTLEDAFGDLWDGEIRPRSPDELAERTAAILDGPAHCEACPEYVRPGYCDACDAVNA